jgi:dihydropteroate synthase
MTGSFQRAEKMIEDGADWLDIGGQSTRPGADLIGEEEELKRVVGAIHLLHSRWPQVPLSVDTWYARVAQEAVAAGASLVNDISGGRARPGDASVVASLKVPYVCMHMKGTPATMHQDAVYDDVVKEVLDYFIRRIEDCRLAGIHDTIVDPGWGFAKNRTHNWQLLRQLTTFPDAGPADLAGRLPQIHHLPHPWHHPRRSPERDDRPSYARSAQWGRHPPRP